MRSFTSTPQLPLWRSKLARSASPTNCLQKKVLSLSGSIMRCSSMALRMESSSVLYPSVPLLRHVFFRWANSIRRLSLSAKSLHATTLLVFPSESVNVPRSVSCASKPMDSKTWHAMYSVRHEFT